MRAVYRVRMSSSSSRTAVLGGLAVVGLAAMYVFGSFGRRTRGGAEDEDGSLPSGASVVYNALSAKGAQGGVGGGVDNEESAGGSAAGAAAPVDEKAERERLLLLKAQYTLAQQEGMKFIKEKKMEAACSKFTECLALMEDLDRGTMQKDRIILLNNRR